jgi:hypothetical protein
MHFFLQLTAQSQKLITTPSIVGSSIASEFPNKKAIMHYCLAATTSLRDVHKTFTDWQITSSGNQWDLQKMDVSHIQTRVKHACHGCSSKTEISFEGLRRHGVAVFFCSLSSTWQNQ